MEYQEPAPRRETQKVAENIKAIMESADISQTQLSKITAVSQQTISYIVSEGSTSSPSIDTLGKLGKPFNLPAWAMAAPLDRAIKHETAVELAKSIEKLLNCSAESQQQVMRLIDIEHSISMRQA